jgi:hypothetical protein
VKTKEFVMKRSIKAMKVVATIMQARRRFFLSVVAVLVLSLMNAGVAHATVPIPSGWSPVKSYTGVRVYTKANPYGYTDYVTIVDLRNATMTSFTGWVFGNQPENGTVERRSLKTHWNNAVAQNSNYKTARVAINGAFFSTNDNPAGIAFGLKANWWRMSYGYEVGGPYKGLERTLAFDPGFGSSSIQKYSRDTFNGGIPDVVGGLDVTANKNSTAYRPRTFVGVRDDDRNGHSETVIFYSSTGARQDWAVKVLDGFGAGSKMMLDGGSSTGLIVGGTTYIAPSYALPHVFIIYSGK